MNIEQIKFDCKFFRGDIPCKPNKTNNCVCTGCNFYSPVSKRILIIKLGAIGDVIRTTPLIVKYRTLFENCHISWITNFPDILPSDQIDAIYTFDFKSVFSLLRKEFDIAINLDKDFEACSLLKDVSAKNKYGFTINDGHIDVINQAAEHKFLTGMFDQYSKENTRSYVDEIFEICELPFNNESYLLPLDMPLDKKWEIIRNIAKGKKIIGLNTGCGSRWKTRMWPQEYWVSLIEKLQQQNYFPVLLGGKDEHETNLMLSEKTEAYYPGHHSLKEFIAIVNQCDTIVTAVSMTMHIAMGLKKYLVLFNNIFNRNEFFLYNNGIIIEPATGCDCYYGEKCSREKSCMNDIAVETVFNAIQQA